MKLLRFTALFLASLTMLSFVAPTILPINSHVVYAQSEDEEEADDEGASSDDCRDALSGAIAWAVCAGIEWVDSSINELLQTLNNLLSVDRSEFETTEMRKAWSYFRNIASLLLVVIGLIMIIGQAVSKE